MKKLDKVNRVVAAGGGLFATYSTYYLAYNQKLFPSLLTGYLMLDLFLTALSGESLPIASRVAEGVYKVESSLSKFYERLKKYFV